MNYEYINKIIEDVYSEFGNKYGDELNKLLVKEQKESEILDKIKEWVLYQQLSNENLEPYISTDKLDEILELLEEIK